MHPFEEHESELSDYLCYLINVALRSLVFEKRQFFDSFIEHLLLYLLDKGAQQKNMQFIRSEKCSKSFISYIGNIRYKLSKKMGVPVMSRFMGHYHFQPPSCIPQIML